MVNRKLLQRNGKPSKFKYIFFIASAIACYYVIVRNGGYTTMILSIGNEEELERSSVRSHQMSHDGYTIRTEGCTIPRLEPFDPNIDSIVRHISRPRTCPGNGLSVIDSNMSHIWVKRPHLNNFSWEISLECCYNAFYRPLYVENIKSDTVDDRVKYGSCITFNDSIKVKDSFVQITCFNNGGIYEKKYLVFPRKLKKKKAHEDLKNSSAYNILILGIDAVSRMNFHRTMPKTLSFLKNNGAVELLGYNKVGDNTFPNVVAMTLGLKLTEMQKACWPHTWNTFDNCPFIWNWFQDVGYVTALAEDVASLGTFNYFKIGFLGKPTDYYLHPFIKEAEKAVGKNKELNTYLCLGDRYFFNVLMDYTFSLIKTVSPLKLFGFIWETTMTHDFLSYPEEMDQTYDKFFKDLKALNYLENTIVFLLSDHGMRWGPLRRTKQGQLEDRLPFVFILTPPSFRGNYQTAFENLKSNAHRLTTPFDIYATLNDLVNMSVITDDMIKQRHEQMFAEQPRGISMFLPIPTNRTCSKAGIDDHWCTCHEEKIIDVKDKVVVEGALFVISHLNNLLRHHANCVKLTLKDVVEAREIFQDTPAENKVKLKWREFMLVVQASPSNGVFEATVRLHSQFSITSTVSRLNLYGDQSSCIRDTALQLYCYCSPSNSVSPKSDNNMYKEIKSR